MYLRFFVAFFTVNNEHIHNSLFKELVLILTNPFTFYAIMKAHVLC